MAKTSTNSKMPSKKPTVKKDKDIENTVGNVKTAIEEVDPEIVEETVETSEMIEEAVPESEEPTIEPKPETVPENLQEEVQDIPDKDEEETPKVLAEEIKDYDFDEFRNDKVKEQEILIPTPPVVLKEREVHVVKPMFPPSKYTKKTIVKKYC